MKSALGKVFRVKLFLLLFVTVMFEIIEVKEFLDLKEKNQADFV